MRAKTNSWKFNPERVVEVRGTLNHYSFGRLMDKPKPGHIIKAWENGEAKPSAGSIEALCVVARKDPNFFFSF